MTDQTKYSVIIPVYNAEATIERCINSLLHEIPREAELLVINDGSQDGSDGICRAYAEKYRCIRYYTKPNGGVSTARNLGLGEARGEYILFADSDDYVSESYWRTIASCLEEYRPDMLQFGFIEHGKQAVPRSCGKSELYGEAPVAKKVANDLRRYSFSSLCNKAFLRAIVERNRIRFAENIHVGEDQLFIFEYVLQVKSLLSMEDYLYNVALESTDSLSRKKRDYLMPQLINVSLRMCDAACKAEMSSSTKRTYRAATAWVFYRSAYSCCKELMKFDLSPRDRRRQIREICRTYRRQRVKPMDIKCLVIAIPILFSLTNTIDRMIRRRA